MVLNDFPGFRQWADAGFDPSLFEDEKGHLTDRDYSWATTQCACEGDPSNAKRGYTLYEPRNCRTGAVMTSPWTTGGEIDNVKRVQRPVVECAIVPVDILDGPDDSSTSTRKDAFHACIMQRININFNDWIDAGLPTQTDYDAWSNDKRTRQPWRPPCVTKYYETDTYGTCPVKMSIQQCCHIIIKDVVPANGIKMRTCETIKQGRRDDPEVQALFNSPSKPKTHILDDDPEYASPFGNAIYVLGRDKVEDAIKKTVTLNLDECLFEPKEYLFSNYFADFWYPTGTKDDPKFKYLGSHMPYMRHWDTTVSAGQKRHGGSFVNTLGSYDTIIGVGREERDKQDAADTGDPTIDGSLGQFESQNSTSVIMPDELYYLADRLSEEQMAEMGRVGGWAELKAHQMWTVRRSNMFCIGRYEKLFKPGAAEDLALYKAGAGYTSMKSKHWSWPLGWRGYATDSRTSAKRGFPYFPSGSNPDAAMLAGLDNARKGDIITYKINGLTYVAYVTGADRDKGFVKIVSWDQGRFPTAAGNSAAWGRGPARTIFRTTVPKATSDKLCRQQLFAAAGGNGCQPSCEDPSFTECILPNSGWTQAKIYRPAANNVDIRKCDGVITKQPPNGAVDLNATYNWDGRPQNASPSVLSQGGTQNVGSDLWGYCANAGLDAPSGWSAGEYSGAGTGATTDVTLCGPEWCNCSKPPEDRSILFSNHGVSSNCDSNGGPITGGPPSGTGPITPR